MMLKLGLAFLAVALITGLFGFGVIPSHNLHEFRMAFFTSGTLSVPILLVALVRKGDE
jgi:uncharacterized membrane protein YtjA (UPF0391 family)